MTYKEIKTICETNKLLLKDLAEELDLSMQGLQTSLEKQTLPIRKVIPLCNFLCISVSQFFGVQNTPADMYYNSQVQHSSGQRAKNIQLGDTKATEALVQQIQEKDKQIAKLLDLLSK